MSYPLTNPPATHGDFLDELQTYLNDINSRLNTLEGGVPATYTGLRIVATRDSNSSPSDFMNLLELSGYATAGDGVNILNSPTFSFDSDHDTAHTANVAFDGTGLYYASHWTPSVIPFPHTVGGIWDDPFSIEQVGILVASGVLEQGPGEFTIEVSNDSTDGTDGTWSVLIDSGAYPGGTNGWGYSSSTPVLFTA